jgi:DNA-binding GntR family transcriptional regulator
VDSDQPVSTPTITEVVAERLRDELRRGTYPAGTRLIQVEVATRLGVSTTPVREAVAILQREGLLDNVARKGAVVPTVTAQDVREIYEMRIALESLAISTAVPKLTDQDLSDMAEVLERWVTAFRQGAFESARELNEIFHARIYTAAGRPRLLKAITNLQEAARAFMNLLSERREHPRDTEAEHRAIFAACTSGDDKEAEKLIRSHLEHSMEIAVRALESDSPTEAP